MSGGAPNSGWGVTTPVVDDAWILVIGQYYRFVWVHSNMKNGYERVPSFKIAEFCLMFVAERERIVDKSPHLTSNLYFRVENTIFFF